MKFRIPSRYRIGGVEHQVKFVKNLGANTRDGGTSSYFTRLCEIDPDLTPPEQRRTFIHETIHHASEIYQVGLSEPNVHRLSNAVNELIQQLQPEKAPTRKGKR